MQSAIVKNVNLAVLIFISAGVLHASPIPEQIDTPELRKAAGVEMKCESHPKWGTVHIDVIWTPEPADYRKNPQASPRMDMIKHAPDGSSETPLQVIYRMEADKKCRASFIIGIFEARHYDLFFRLSGQKEYFLPLREYLEETKTASAAQ